MTGPFDDGLGPMELAIFLAISEEEELSGEEKLLAAQESEQPEKDELEDDDEDPEDSRPLRAEDIF